MLTAAESPRAIRALAQDLAREAQAAAGRGDGAAVRIARLARTIADQATAVEQDRAAYADGILTAAI